MKNTRKRLASIMILFILSILLILFQYSYNAPVKHIRQSLRKTFSNLSDSPISVYLNCNNRQDIYHEKWSFKVKALQFPDSNNNTQQALSALTVQTDAICDMKAQQASGQYNLQYRALPVTRGELYWHQDSLTLSLPASSGEYLTLSHKNLSQQLENSTLYSILPFDSISSIPDIEPLSIACFQLQPTLHALYLHFYDNTFLSANGQFPEELATLLPAGYQIYEFLPSVEYRTYISNLLHNLPFSWPFSTNDTTRYWLAIDKDGYLCAAMLDNSSDSLLLHLDVLHQIYSLTYHSYNTDIHQTLNWRFGIVTQNKKDFHTITYSYNDTTDFNVSALSGTLYYNYEWDNSTHRLHLSIPQLEIVFPETEHAITLSIGYTLSPTTEKPIIPSYITH